MNNFLPDKKNKVEQASATKKKTSKRVFEKGEKVRLNRERREFYLKQKDELIEAQVRRKFEFIYLKTVNNIKLKDLPRYSGTSHSYVAKLLNLRTECDMKRVVTAQRIEYLKKSLKEEGLIYETPEDLTPFICKEIVKQFRLNSKRNGAFSLEEEEGV